jgi:hypothetical protein
MAVSITCPYGGRADHFYRGNLHTHTDRSDGKLRVEEVVARYLTAGHDFLAISDRDVCTPPFSELTLVSLPALEISAGGPRLLAIGVERLYDTRLSRAEIIAQIVADGGLCVLSHPNGGENQNHWTLETMLAAGPFHGIEIYNGVQARWTGSPWALDRWDALLGAGRRVWGFANDDFHDTTDGPRAFNGVVAGACTPGMLVAAMKAGRFYASTGLKLETIEFTGRVLKIVAPDATQVRFITKGGVVAKTVDAPEATYQISGKDSYVRAELSGPGPRAAFTQPIFVDFQ